MSADFGMQGMDGLLALLEELEEARLLAASRPALLSGLEAVRTQAALLCPQDTGALAGSIRVRLREANGALTGEVCADAPYAVPVEMGTASRAAQPFLYPALRLRQGDCVRHIGAALARHVQKGGA